MRAFTYLMFAILKFTAGFTKFAPSLIVVFGYGTAFYLLAQSLNEGMSIGSAYAIWSGLGTALIVAVGVILFREELSLWRIAGISLIISGVIILNVLGGANH